MVGLVWGPCMLPCISPGPSVSALGKAVPYNTSIAVGNLQSGVTRTYVRSLAQRPYSAWQQGQERKEKKRKDKKRKDYAVKRD